MNSLAISSDTTANTRSTPRISSFRLSLLVAFLLLASGCVHLVLFAVTGTTWQGPVSLRKPALFGISAGMTTWSLVWLMTQLKPVKLDRALTNSLATSLFVEVLLITIQYWRGVASHFNHSNPFDAAIESTMLGLILFVSAGIGYLTVRTFWLREMEPAMVVAIRGGMWLLTVSCLLGMGISLLGEASLSAGRPPELWGKAGVLKFPHGVALHAIQLLPFLVWLTRNLGPRDSTRLVQSFLAAQIFFLIYAVWQTSQGRDRFDWDTPGGIVFGIAVLSGLLPVLLIARKRFRMLNVPSDPGNL